MTYTPIMWVAPRRTRYGKQDKEEIGRRTRAAARYCHETLAARRSAVLPRSSRATRGHPCWRREGRHYRPLHPRSSCGPLPRARVRRGWRQRLAGAVMQPGVGLHHRRHLLLAPVGLRENELTTHDCNAPRTCAARFRPLIRQPTAEATRGVFKACGGEKREAVRSGTQDSGTSPSFGMHLFFDMFTIKLCRPSPPP